MTKPCTFNRNGTFKTNRAEVAQSVEQGTENPRVGSSILSLGTKEIKGLRLLSESLFYWLLLFCYRLFEKLHFPTCMLIPD